jgi:glyoxylase-like metal-dependent hydrolase (beta-lactamase superfamily II)
LSESDRFRTFHQGGRWQGLPLRVEDPDAPPRFEPVTSQIFRRDPGAAPATDDQPADAPDILMLGLPNAGMMAGQPTNVYLMGYVASERALTLIDAGSEESYDVLLAALEETGIPLERIGQIVLTHCHPDHVGSAAALKEITGAPVLAHSLEQAQIERFGNGLQVDHWVGQDESITGDGFEMQTVFTPGHSPGHYCVVEPKSRVLIAGDMISGFGSVGIFPPNGSMSDYLTSLRRLLALDQAERFSLVCPGHGPVIPDARSKIEEYIEHRLAREEEVFQAVSNGAGTMNELLPTLYPEVQQHLSFAARSTLQAHLDKLVDDGRIGTTDGKSYVMCDLASR